MTRKRFGLLLGIINISLIILYGSLIFTRDYESVYAGHNSNLSWTGVDSRLIVYSTTEMKKGVYTISMQYAVDNDAYVLSCAAEVDGAAYPVIYAEKYVLDSQRNDLSFRLWLNSDVDYLTIRIYADSATENIRIDNINIETEYKETLGYLTLRFCIILFLIDIIITVILYRNKIYSRIKDSFYVISGLLIIFFICSLSVLSAYQVKGHDIQFHMVRIAGLAEGLMSGNFPVRIQPGWCNDYGYAVSVFYSDTLLYIPALLYTVGIPLIYTYKFYVLCINIGTIGIAYFCYKRLSRDKYIAVVCTCLYCLSINRIMNVFVRAAVGEYSAYMFLPFVLLGVKEILCADTEDSTEKHSWVFLCIGMTGLFQTHVLSVEMVCILLAIVVVALCRRFLYWGEACIEFLKSIVVTICLNFGFLVPFLDYSRQNLNVFAKKDSYGIQWAGLSLYELFSLGTEGYGAAIPSTSGLAGRIPLSLGLGIIIVIVMTFIVLFRFAWNKNEKRRMLFVMGIVSLGLFMSTYYFPWNRLTAIPLVRDIVSSLQFPWRFISVTMPILVYMACLLFLKIKESCSREKTGYILVGIYLITVLQGMYYTDLSLRNDSYVKYDGRDILWDANSLHGDEYLFEGTDKYSAMTDQDVSGQNVSVINTERRGNRMIVSCMADQDAYIEIPMFAYKYYRCIDMTTKESFPVTTGENNKIHVSLPSGYQGDLTVYFAEPWYWRVSEIVSLLSFAGLAAYIIRTKSKMEK